MDMPHPAGFWRGCLGGHLGFSLSQSPGAGGITVSLLGIEQAPMGLPACIREATARSSAFFPEGGVGHWVWLSRAPWEPLEAPHCPRPGWSVHGVSGEAFKVDGPFCQSATST